MIRVLAIVALLAGCSDGRPIRAWTLDVEGAPSVVITLPNSLTPELPHGEIDFALHTAVSLAPDERGHTLTLVFACYHGALALDVDGAPIEDIGDGDGEHRFVIPPAQRDRIELRVAARQDANSVAFGFGAEPRLVSGSLRSRSSSATFNHAFSIIEAPLVVLIGLLFALLFAIDRSRRSDGVFAIMTLVSLVMPLWHLDLIPLWVFLAGMAIIGPLQALFIHLEFELGPMPRWLVIAYGLGFLVAILSPLAFVLLQIVMLAFFVLVFPWGIHLVRRLLRVAKGNRRVDARIVLAALVIANATFIPAWLIAWFGISVDGGRHVESIAVLVWVAAICLVLARQHVAHQREGVRANAELRRQVAERSKDLAEALAKLARQPALDAGHTIDGRYRVLERIGAGGMGTVYAVERASDKVRFALKTLRGTGGSEAMARLAREAQIAAGISHPNLVPVLDVGLADGSLFLVMPLLGGSLATQRVRFGDASWARPLLAQIALGLQALHERGIIHRDLKPSNILLDDGVARIADFGLATLVEDGTLTATGLTRAGDVFGTPAYMAPELAGGVRDPAPASDIFALGVIGYELLSGRAPFAEAPIFARVFAAPAAVDPIIDRCLDADPAKRPSAGDVVAALR
jgi:Protein kinase domain